MKSKTGPDAEPSPFCFADIRRAKQNAGLALVHLELQIEVRALLHLGVVAVNFRQRNEGWDLLCNTVL